MCVFCSPKSSTSLAKTRNSSLLEWVTAEFNPILWLNPLCAKSLVILAWLICFGVIRPNNVYIHRLHVTSQSYHTLCEASWLLGAVLVGKHLCFNCFVINGMTLPWTYVCYALCYDLSNVKLSCWLRWFLNVLSQKVWQQVDLAISFMLRSSLTLFPA